MKCPLRIYSEGFDLNCYKDECAWWVTDAEIEGSKATGACAVLEIASKGDDEEEI